MREELQALRETLDPSLAMVDQQRPGHDHYTLGIPSSVDYELTQMYSKHPNPHLPDLADAFVRVFNVSTRKFQPRDDDVLPSQEQYLSLMASQFLMEKILASPECKELFEQPQHQHSHWKTYINFLRRVRTSFHRLSQVEDDSSINVWQIGATRRMSAVSLRNGKANHYRSIVGA